MTASVMTRLLPRATALIALACAGAAAQEIVPLPAQAPAAVWEGAIGLTGAYRPEYPGAAKASFKFTPALFVRYGRFTATNASGFSTRRADDVVRGLALDLVQSDELRINAALRIDGGRSESGSAELAGMGDIDPTLRTRLTADYRLDPVWRVGFNWSIDALGRGGGNFGDIGVSWQHRFGPDTLLTAGASLSAGGDRYMQSYYGVTPEQAARSVYPVYAPSAGLRDISASINWRQDIDNEWIVLAGFGVSRLLGPAAASPLTYSRNGWAINGGLARRF